MIWVRALVIAMALITVGSSAAFSLETNLTTSGNEHALDFNVGSWKVHAKYRHQTADGNVEWFDLAGTARVSAVLDGTGQLEEIKADGPQKSFQVAIVFLYNAETKEWSKVLTTPGSGAFDTPMIESPGTDTFAFYDQEFYHGKTALIRTVWSGVTENSQHVEDAFSYDAGKSWTSYFVADFARTH